MTAVYSWRLSFPPDPYFDEVYHVRSARELISLSGYFDYLHPPLGKALIGLGIVFFGDNSFAWRFFPLMSGLSLIVILYVITQKLTRSHLTAALAAFFYAFDCSLLTLSRMALLNTPMELFMLLSLLCLVLKDHPGPDKKKYFLLSGIFLGLSYATRIFAFTAPALLLPFIIKINHQEGQNWRRTISDLLIYFTLIPLVIYFGIHLIIPLIKDRTWKDIWDLQTQMFMGHWNLKKPHHYGSAWWSWPLMVRPIWYYFHPLIGGGIQGILCIGNPAVYWMIPLAIIYTAWSFWRKRLFLYGFLLAAFFSQWVPWIFIGRVKFFHYFETAMPFAAICLALMATRIWESGKSGRIAVMVYGVLILAMFTYWYPLLTGIHVSDAFFKHHLWFRSWI